MSRPDGAIRDNGNNVIGGLAIDLHSAEGICPVDAFAAVGASILGHREFITHLVTYLAEVG